MKNWWLKHISRFLLVLLPVGPILWSAHIILNEHANSFEQNELSFQKIASPHTCSHFLHGEYRGILPQENYKEELPIIIVVKNAFSEVRISHKTFHQLRFYVRGPPFLDLA